MRPSLHFQITSRPPHYQLIAEVEMRLSRRANYALGVSAITFLCFAGLYTFDYSQTETSMLTTVSCIDYAMVAAIGACLGSLIFYTKTRFLLQLLQPITEQGVLHLRKLSVAHKNVLWYLNQIDQQKRVVLEVEAKVCIAHAQGVENASESI